MFLIRNLEMIVMLSWQLVLEFLTIHPFGSFTLDAFHSLLSVWLSLPDNLLGRVEIAELMSPVADSSIFDGNLAAAVNHLLHVPETIEKVMFPSSHSHDKNENQGMGRIPVDVLETSKEYLFYMDVPGLSKTDIQARVSPFSTDSEDVVDI